MQPDDVGPVRGTQYEYDECHSQDDCTPQEVSYLGLSLLFRDCPNRAVVGS